ncbi:MAG: cytochrome b N-terminal domain-containing protein [Geminicoccaceae bacterium]|nr:cytochrome b N-terminal domain-containing protein [Geminicoccaceae bacterium]MDW8341447.1 cytochrome b N-terminal domain-containing protein [Geminicoccaceae bacterium]
MAAPSGFGARAVKFLRARVRLLFDRAESLLGLAFPPAWNPLLNLGALGFFFFWIVTASGIYVYIFFDTGVTQAYDSVEYMTREQWYLAGVMRSFHRYGSDALVIVAALHLLREFGQDRYRGVRWFSWLTGIVVLVLVFVAGITGYWLVWDKLAQYVAVVTSEWLDALGIFGEPIARNFVAPGALDDRFFTLMLFVHIAVPLVALIVLWVHLQRIAKPRINPPRGLACGAFVSLLALSLAHPATSRPPADLASVPGEVGLDWFYLAAYPLLEILPAPLTWATALFLFALALSIPWLPPMRLARPPRVDLDNCNGCARCFADCPYDAITMVPRSDGAPFSAEARVDPGSCVRCGICAGACPTATPFRRASALSPGIDLPDLPIAALRDRVEAEGRRLSGRGRIMVFGCGEGISLEGLASARIGVVRLNCAGQLPPAFVDYVLSRDLAEGVLVTGCAANACHARFGILWTEARFARTRDPQLRRRVPAERLRTLWAGRLGRRALEAEIASFARALEALPPPAPVRRAPGLPATREVERA